MTLEIERRSVFGVADAGLAERLNHESQRFRGFGPAVFVCEFSDLHAQSKSSSPRVILLDDQILAGRSVVDSLRQLMETAPAVFIAAPARQAEVESLVAEGDLDFVALVGNCAGLAASLVERRLRWAERSETPLGAPWTALPADTAEIFRHEINNPLTGILGNAELVLSHRDRLPPADAQRLQTVVDLAVRLRETTRRLSNAWEARKDR